MSERLDHRRELLQLARFGDVDSPAAAVQYVRSSLFLDRLVQQREVGTVRPAIAQAAGSGNRPSAMADGHLDAAQRLMDKGIDCLLAGRCDDAGTFLQEAKEAFAKAGSDHACSVADCEYNLAVAAMRTGGAHVEVFGLFHSAWGIYRSNGRWAQAAQAAVQLGLVCAERTDADRPGAEDLTKALTWLVPAVLALESVRFHFPFQEQRASWKNATQGFADAMHLAWRAGDHLLVADLIETARTFDAGRLADTDGVEATEGVAGLRLGPPARLRMPGARIALERYHELAVSQYGAGDAAHGPTPGLAAALTDPGVRYDLEAVL